MKRLNILFILIFSFIPFTNAQDFELANEFYSNQQYDSARVIYESLLEEDEFSFEIYYNLGNTFFKQNQLGNAILHWEKARKLSPSNQLVIENLNYAYSLTRDKFDIEIKSEGFIKNFIYEKSPNFWSVLSISLALIVGLSIFLFFTSKNDRIHQISFYVSIVVFVLLIGSIVSASMQKSYLSNSNEAIVIIPRVQVLTSPYSEAEKSFPLHEGAKVEIIGEDGDWLEILVNKDNRGWMQVSSIEKI